MRAGNVLRERPANHVGEKGPRSPTGPYAVLREIEQDRQESTPRVKGAYRPSAVRTSTPATRPPCGVVPHSSPRRSNRLDAKESNQEQTTLPPAPPTASSRNGDDVYESSWTRPSGATGQPGCRPLHLAINSNVKSPCDNRPVHAHRILVPRFSLGMRMLEVYENQYFGRVGGYEL